MIDSLKLSLLLVLAAIATPEPKYFRYQRALEQLPDQAAQTCVAIDSGIFPHAAPYLADLRLYQEQNGDRAEVPYTLLLAAQAPRAEQALAATNFGIRKGETVFDVAMPGGNYSDVELQTSNENFIATVNVSGISPPNAETKLGAYTIFDLTKQRLGRSTVLHLPLSNFSTLHFEISSTVREWKISGLQISSQPPANLKYRIVAQSSQWKQMDRSTIVEFNTPTNTPVDQIVFNPEQTGTNFSRAVIISEHPEVEGNSSSQNIADFSTASSILRIHKVEDGRRIDEDNLVVDVTDLASRRINSVRTKWTIAIQNADDAPLALKSVALRMTERDLCFQSVPGGRYELYYGDPALIAPSYDYAQLFTPDSHQSVATLGDEQANPTWQSRPDDRPFTERHPALLWAALILAIALLGIFALQSLKKAAA